MELLMVDPPSVVEAVSWLRALAQDIPPDTTVCRRRAHGRGRRTTEVVVSRDPDRTGTMARACLSRSGGACRADEVHDSRRLLAGQSGETKRRKCGECLRYPNGYPNWRRTNRRTLLVRSNGADAGRCSLQALYRWLRAMALGESCRTWRRGSSTHLPLDRHLEVRDRVLRPGAAPKRSASRKGNSRPRVAVSNSQSGKAF